MSTQRGRGYQAAREKHRYLEVLRQAYISALLLALTATSAHAYDWKGQPQSTNVEDERANPPPSGATPENTVSGEFGGPTTDSPSPTDSSLPSANPIADFKNNREIMIKLGELAQKNVAPFGCARFPFIRAKAIELGKLAGKRELAAAIARVEGINASLDEASNLVPAGGADICTGGLAVLAQKLAKIRARIDQEDAGFLAAAKESRAKSKEIVQALNALGPPQPSDPPLCVADNPKITNVVKNYDALAAAVDNDLRTSSAKLAAYGEKIKDLQEKSGCGKAH